MDQAQNQWFLQAVKDGQLSKASALLANEKIDINQPDQVSRSIVSNFNAILLPFVLLLAS